MPSSLQEKRRRLDALRPFDGSALRSLREALRVEWTYHSNAIEGNTLTLKETRVVLEGITIGGHSIIEHLEAINHAQAIDWLEEIVGAAEPLTERLIRELHALILKGIDDANAGKYRTANVLIAGAVHRPPESLHVASEMESLVAGYRRLLGTGDDVARAAWLHAEFVRIHPFIDGNGRTARLLMNLDLMRHGWPPVIIRKDDRLRYYEALDRAHTADDHAPFKSLIHERLESALDLHLEILSPPEV